MIQVIRSIETETETEKEKGKNKKADITSAFFVLH